MKHSIKRLRYLDKNGKYHFITLEKLNSLIPGGRIYIFTNRYNKINGIKTQELNNPTYLSGFLDYLNSLDEQEYNYDGTNGCILYYTDLLDNKVKYINKLELAELCNICKCKDFSEHIKKFTYRQNIQKADLNWHDTESLSEFVLHFYIENAINTTKFSRDYNYSFKDNNGDTYKFNGQDILDLIREDNLRTYKYEFFHKYKLKYTDFKNPDHFTKFLNLVMLNHNIDWGCIKDKSVNVITEHYHKGKRSKQYQYVDIETGEIREISEKDLRQMYDPHNYNYYLNKFLKNKGLSKMNYGDTILVGELVQMFNKKVDNRDNKNKESNANKLSQDIIYYTSNKDRIEISYKDTKLKYNDKEYDSFSRLVYDLGLRTELYDIEIDSIFYYSFVKNDKRDDKTFDNIKSMLQNKDYDNLVVIRVNNGYTYGNLKYRIYELNEYMKLNNITGLNDKIAKIKSLNQEIRLIYNNTSILNLCVSDDIIERACKRRFLLEAHDFIHNHTEYKNHKFIKSADFNDKGIEHFLVENTSTPILGKDEKYQLLTFEDIFKMIVRCNRDTVYSIANK